MNPRRSIREDLNLTQTEAAMAAGVSLATWRRWEEDQDSVSADTRAKCDAVLDGNSAVPSRDAEDDARFQRAWKDCPYLTPRQAAALSSVLYLWEDLYLREWLEGGYPNEPLHTMPPFSNLDRRVTIYINDNKAFAEKARERCRAVAEQISHGTLPFHRDGCFFDELLIAAALSEAQDQLTDMPELFEGIPPRLSPVDEDMPVTDDDWDMVSDVFDDQCRWDEWEVPVYTDHPLLAAIIAERHPYTWFDPSSPTGPGYLNRLSGLVVDGDAAEPG
jgi:transcriptional regulator with XRE-family HTH domain